MVEALERGDIVLGGCCVAHRQSGIVTVAGADIVGELGQRRASRFVEVGENGFSHNTASRISGAEN